MPPTNHQTAKHSSPIPLASPREPVPRRGKRRTSQGVVVVGWLAMERRCGSRWKLMEIKEEDRAYSTLSVVHRCYGTGYHGYFRATKEPDGHEMSDSCPQGTDGGMVGTWA